MRQNVEDGHPRQRVLVVDDDPLCARALGRVLSARYAVTLAAGGRQALALLESGERYDAIVCDICMPDMGGVALHEAIRTADSQQASRMLFVTGGAGDAGGAFVRCHADRVLAKPVDGDDLRRAVARLADGAPVPPAN